MHFKKWKSPIIILLIILAIYQTTILWFESSSSYSFFHMIKEKFNVIDAKKKIASSIDGAFINIGNNKFIKKYNNINDIGYKKTIDDIIAFSLKKGKLSPVKNFNISEILDNECIIYTYAYDIKGDDISKIFGIKDNLSKISSFDTIAILPLEKSDGIKTIFFSSKTLIAYQIIANKSSLKININNIINNVRNTKEKSYYYISSEQNNIDIFSKNQFLPKATQDIFYINNLNATNPLEKGGGILLSESAEYIDIFFKNPATKLSSFINNTYTYSDESIVVKYYTNGVLEYANYKSTLSNNDASPYDIAIKFLQNDVNIKNEYYLENYHIENKKIIFNFNYKINDFPIKLSNKEKKQTDMSSMIELTVEGGEVSKYRRIIYDFDVSKESTKIENNYINSLKTLAKQHNSPIDALELSYNFDGINAPTKINWLINVNNNTYFKDISYKEEG